MARDMWQPFRRLFGPQQGPHIEVVAYGNALVAAALGFLLWWRWDLNFGWAALAIALLTFFVLTACLARRSTAWIPMIAGSGILSIGGVLLCAALAQTVGGSGWLVAILGGAFGLVLSFALFWRSYRRFARSIHE